MERYITEHAFALMRDTPDAPFSHEAVASAAGISARTAYRYFPTQKDLVGAVWRHLRDLTGTRWPMAEPEILPMLRELFAQFERNAALTRAVMAASPRANISEHGSVEGRAAFREALSARLPQMTPDAGEQLIATCVAIYSAPFWQMLRDRGQLSAQSAADAACTAMAAVLAAGVRDARRPDVPPPVASLTAP
jgi:AcrR family transcriptional regulator